MALTAGWPVRGVSDGTFTFGTSTLTMTGTTKKMNILSGEDISSLIINGTITIDYINATSGYLKLRGSVFTVGSSKTLSATGYVRLYENPTLTFSTPATNISGLTVGLANRSDTGTLSIPEVTVAGLFCTTSGGTVQATGDLTITSELEVNSGTTFKANGYTITPKLIDMNGTAILDMTVAKSKLDFSNTMGFLDNCTGTLKTGIIALYTDEQHHTYYVDTPQ